MPARSLGVLVLTLVLGVWKHVGPHKCRPVTRVRVESVTQRRGRLRAEVGNQNGGMAKDSLEGRDVRQLDQHVSAALARGVKYNMKILIRGQVALDAGEASRVRPSRAGRAGSSVCSKHVPLGAGI